ARRLGHEERHEDHEDNGRSKSERPFFLADQSSRMVSNPTRHGPERISISRTSSSSSTRRRAPASRESGSSLTGCDSPQAPSQTRVSYELTTAVRPAHWGRILVKPGAARSCDRSG